MAYRFKVSEPFDDGVRRIAVEQIDRALAQLQTSKDPASAVHETRKSLKRIRALLRLARPGLSSQDYLNENARYRDIGRSLSGARDRHVLIETVGKFQTAAQGRTKSAFAAALARLEERNGVETAGDENTAIAQAVTALQDGRAAMVDLRLKGGGYGVAWDGLERTYKQAVATFETAYETNDNEALHEWRKRVQHHWRHMSLLREAWPEMTQARVQAAKGISEMLGEDHDIAVMLAALDGKEPAKPARGTRATTRKAKDSLSENQHKLTLAAAVERQTELRAQCHVLGLRLFAEPAAAFADRFKHYWASSHETAVRRSSH